MKKITDFIINKRYFILVIFIILAVYAGFLSTKVKTNYDIAKYLPATSETRIGMDIMEDEFAGTETSNFNLMFKGLKNEEKEEIYNYLDGIEEIDEVDYDNTEKYNKDDYTLYVITVDDDADSKIATDTYNKVTEKYKDYEIYTSGDIASRNKPVLEHWIIALAIGCALIILIIMCESYIEPFLFLTTILIAVVLNKGTNIIFESVSNITQGIVMILQLALSMDYSIMLMNRYEQEKAKESNKVTAMKDALYHAFQSISSSSITTIVGLVVLVFMSFTIGKDLGLVLAKGVLFSLISIFFVLPGVILMFDKWIVKTKKKSPNIKLKTLGRISYKCRYIAIPLFLLIFIGSILSKQTLNILYTNSEEDKVSKFFTENNQMAIIYKNEEEEKIAKILPKLEEEEKAEEVLGYSNTINQKLTYDKLNDKLADLGSDAEVEDYLLKIIYYNYYNREIKNKMTFNEFVKFIKEEVYNNKNVSDKIDDKTRENIDKLENFITGKEINKKRTAKQIGNILEIDESKVKDILILYSAKKDNTKIGVDDFIKFMKNDVAKDKKYSKNIDLNSLESINKLSKFIDKKTIQTKMTATQMAKLFGLEKNVTEDLYKYYISVNKIDTKLSLAQFSEFVLNDVLPDKSYASSFNKETIESIKLLSSFSNKDVIKNEMNIKQLSNLFGIDENLITQILLLKYMNIESNTTLSISEFIKGVNYVKSNTNYLNGIDVSNVEQLYIFANNENNINISKMDKAHLSVIFDNVSKGLVDKVYLIAGLPNSYSMSLQEFVNLIISKR